VGFLSRFFTKTTVKPIEAIGNIVDKVFEHHADHKKAQAMVDRLALRPEVLQSEINKMESQHRSMFVAGWRPAIGWICAIGLSFPFILNPLIEWFGFTGPDFPVDQLTELVLALLGLGTLRTFEKLAGRTK